MTFRPTDDGAEARRNRAQRWRQSRAQGDGPLSPEATRQAIQKSVRPPSREELLDRVLDDHGAVGSPVWLVECGTSLHLRPPFWQSDWWLAGDGLGTRPETTWIYRPRRPGNPALKWSPGLAACNREPGCCSGRSLWPGPARAPSPAGGRLA
jgi:hypothetical protein